MKIEGHILAIDELCLGFYMAYGGDEDGEFHMLTIGLLIFQVSFYRYL